MSDQALRARSARSANLRDGPQAARVADRILFLKDGALVADDRTAAVMTSPMLSQIYNIEAEILRTRTDAIQVAALRHMEAAL
ncbi:MAG: hypothetical protein ACK5IB_14420 [Qingshengfaniella sp.]